MARPRSFDEAEVIDRAMRTFWQHGYDATAIGELEKTTGISRISIYNAFGDKEGLFIAALDRYHRQAVEIYDETVAKGSLKEVVGLFQMMSAEAPEGSPAHAGCLMVNTVLDVRRMSDPIRERVMGYREMLVRSFRSALANARDAGEIEGSDEVIAQRAEFLVGVLWGALSTIRVNCATTSAAAIAREVAQTVKQWTRRET
ncbi:TetR/AcrR family transcriptional regulator [Roseobacter sp. CCS2]|uniref:TetR/AcrR family transcriptional regulator n=1 Tax=Roseobacter sp. CCS2 TaxID=391593 RepID=UPI0000F3E4E8|nr:TetR/AcrR family transcriptional regulator [Roseobacter sp. CCS2]EBA12631.1 transcriptional regulator, TetR family protein [Roseobacter sp. CCS2]